MAFKRKAKKAAKFYGKYKAIKGAYATAALVAAGYSALKAARSRRQQQQPMQA